MTKTYLEAGTSLVMHLQKNYTAMYTSCVEQRGSTHKLRGCRRESAEDDDAVAAAAAMESCMLDRHAKNKQGPQMKIRPSRPEGWSLHGLGILALPWETPLLDPVNCLQRSLDTARQMLLPIRHSRSPLIHSSAAALKRQKKKQICFWWEPHPTSNPTWIKNRPVFNDWISLHHSGFSSGRYQMVKKRRDETKTHSSKGAGASLAPSMRLIPVTQTALLANSDYFLYIFISTREAVIT